MAKVLTSETTGTPGERILRVLTSADEQVALTEAINAYGGGNAPEAAGVPVPTYDHWSFCPVGDEPILGGVVRQSIPARTRRTSIYAY